MAIIAKGGIAAARARGAKPDHMRIAVLPIAVARAALAFPAEIAGDTVRPFLAPARRRSTSPSHGLGRLSRNLDPNSGVARLLLRRDLSAGGGCHAVAPRTDVA